MTMQEERDEARAIARSAVMLLDNRTTDLTDHAAIDFINRFHALPWAKEQA